jgi:hypothetical protein
VRRSIERSQSNGSASAASKHAFIRIDRGGEISSWDRLFSDRRDNRTQYQGSNARPRHCESSAGGDGAVHGPPLRGRGRSKPSLRKVLDRFEIQDRRVRPRGRLSPACVKGSNVVARNAVARTFSEPQSCQGDELFGVKGHGSAPTPKAGRKASTCAPDARLSR